MDHKYLAIFEKQQSIPSQDSLDILDRREDTLVCQLECIRQSSKILLSLYTVIKFKVVLDVMVIL